MVIQLWKNKGKVKDDDPDYLALQKQRTNEDDGSGAYQTVQIGTGYKMEAPDGETYLSVKITGITDNVWTKTKKAE